MDLQHIRLSALGRDVHVGNLYNYYADSIFTNNVKVPQEKKSVDSIPEMQWIYLPQKLPQLKYGALGIDAHLRNSIDTGSIDLSQLWFANFLNSSQSKDEENVAQVTFFFRVVRRNEILLPDFIDSKMNDYKLESGGRATHLVEKVVYGAECICSMEKSINRTTKETKKKAEEIIYLAAKEYFNQNFGCESASPNLPAALDNVYCKILSSFDVGNHLQGSCQTSFQYLRDALSFDKNDRVDKWKPIEITLRNIPEQMEALLRSEKERDMKFAKERHEITFKLIWEKSKDIKNNSLLNYFLHFKKTMCQFHGLLNPFWEKIVTFYDIFESPSSDQVLKEKEISNLLSDAMDWLIHRHDEIQRILCLFKGTKLTVKDWEDIKISSGTNQTKCFVMYAESNQNSVVESIQKFIDTDKSVPVVRLLVLPILFVDVNQLKKIRETLLSLAEEKRSNHSNQSCIIYHIRLTSEYRKLPKGLYLTIENYEKKLAENRINSPMESQRALGIEQGRNFQVTDESKQLNVPASGDYQSAKKGYMNSIQANPAVPFEASMQSNTEMGIVRQALSSNSPSKVNQANGLDKAEEEGRRFEDPKSESVNLDGNENCLKRESTADAISKSFQYFYSSTSTSDREFCHPQETAEMDCSIEMPPYDSIENGPVNNQRIAEFFTEEKNRHSKLIKKSQPNVYLLNATETVISEDLRLFEIGSPSFNFHNHKVIILMGATGCGKSTLINGMVNHILGVQWKDPFRFKCVREDETVAKNQAKSQTSSVTAYTIRHHEGMAVPYSITIIDTPGYGDTGGVKRDKEITRNIQKFLTGQEIRIDEIHAACFVASSGDSRLTTTQRYIIDSALSIFGKDVKENIRLLVTFADNADPPVVEACHSANFPVTSASTGIIYSKFNSSVLYAFNQQSGEDDSCFDELFWDMGQENFTKFFTTLEGMKGRDLKTTREVIHSRQLLEQSLKCIEEELEVCLFNIENIETFQRKMKHCGQKMDNNKHFVIEKKEMKKVRVPCENEFYAFNCNKCEWTCEKPIRCTNPEKIIRQNKKYCEYHFCSHFASDHNYERFQFGQETVTIKTTLLDLKAKYDSNANEKEANEQLLADCSDKVNIAKAKVFSLLDQVGENVRSLESTALRSSSLSPSDYLCLMKSRVAEEQGPGYLTRLETLSELQKSFEDNEVTKKQQAVACSKQPFQANFQSTRDGDRGWKQLTAGRGYQCQQYQYDISTSYHRHLNPPWKN